MSRAENFDRSDFEIASTQPAAPVAPPTLSESAAGTEKGQPPVPTGPRWMWPINPIHIQELGDSVLVKRPVKNRPHEGLDIFAPAGVRIYAASSGTVMRVRDGRKSANTKTRAAGLYVDVLTDPDPSGTQYIQRYLHLGKARGIDQKRIEQGSPIGELAQAHTSGLAERPHLHFEVRAIRKEGGYGPPLDPRRFFPPLSVG